MWPEIPPVEPHERGIEELTGVRPHKGTLMYYRQLGVHDPYEAAEAPEPFPGERTADLVYYLEQSHHKAQPAKHTVQGQRIRTHNSSDVFRPQTARRVGRGNQVRPEESRELVGRPRPGRATELFLQGRVRADHHVVDETNVCPTVPKSQYKPGPRFTLKKSPWIAACESSWGDPREAFEENRPPTKERLQRQPPATAHVSKASRPTQNYTEMDYAHAPRPRGGQQPHQHGQQHQFGSSSTWKGGMNQPVGQSFKRFHAGVVPYETDFNRKAVGWQSNYVPGDPTDFIFPQDDLDTWNQSSKPSFSGSGSAYRNPTQYGDYNSRPKSWQTADQQQEEEPYVPYQQRRAAYEVDDQSSHYHQQQQRQQQQPRYSAGRAPRRGRGSAAVRQDFHAGPRTWDGGLMESDDL